MKKAAILLGPTLALTVFFYLLVYYLLPGPPPSAALVLLLAGLALALVWSSRQLFSRRQPQHPPEPPHKPGPPTAAVLLIAATLALPAHGTATAAKPGAPSITCSAAPAALKDGDAATLVPQARSPVGSALKLTYTASSGQIYTLADGSVIYRPEPYSTGDVTIHCTAMDDRGRSATAVTVVHIVAPARLPGRKGVIGETGPDTTAADMPASPPSSPPLTAPAPVPAPMESAAPQSPAPAPGGGAPAMPRVSSSAVLLPSQSESAGYGLYSYILFSRAPSAADLPRYRALLGALLAQMPFAGEIEKHLPRARINITFVPVTAWPAGQQSLPLAAQAESMLAHYDYARAEAILGSLPGALGPGPVIASTLTPLSYDRQPHPVLVHDLSHAQPALMADYVSTFRNQVATERFWQPSTLAEFALSLRNLLETAAVGLGMGQAAVSAWVKYLQ